MAVDEALSAYSTTAASNTPSGASTVGPDLDNQLRDIKKNVRRAAQHFKGVSGDGNFSGAIKVDDSASPTWTLSIRGSAGDIPLFQIDASTQTAMVYSGSSPSGSFANEYLSESTASARATIMGSLLGVVAGEATTASASHRLAAMGIGPTIGTVSHTIETTAPDGWLALNADTIGNVSASATHTNSMFEILFTKLWNSTAQAQVPVEGGRGASAAADWSANKYMRLPDARGRSIIGTGTGTTEISGSGTLTARTNAAFGGEETHEMTTAEMVTHGHPTRVSSGGDVDPTGGILLDATNAANYPAHTSTVSSTRGEQIGGSGGSTPFNVMHPWIAFNGIIKF